jgi:UDP-N-acetylmuramoyl-L-alanyl-D-glutamate--2,6-diaminopimelate ligase
MEQYHAAKLRLFEGLQTLGSKQGEKQAVINADDPAAASFIAAAQKAGARVTTYGLNTGAAVRGEAVEIDFTGAAFKISGPHGVCELKLSLTGRFNVYNALCAFTTALVMGVPVRIITQALAGVRQVPGRFVPVNVGQDFAVIVDYAHTPDGLENILITARQLTQGRVLTVYGCGGDRDRAKRPQMGQIAARYSDYQLITADNPRTEDQDQIAGEILAGVRGVVENGAYLVEPDRRKAIRLAINMAEPGDLVLIAGKGHETYQIIGTTKLPFDDTVEAKAAISLKGVQR